MNKLLASTPQKNPWTSDWITFFRDHRIGFQLQLIKEQYRYDDLYAKGKRSLSPFGTALYSAVLKCS